MNCPECGRKFATYDGFYHHLKRKHPEASADVPSPRGGRTIVRIVTLPSGPEVSPGVREDDVQ